MVLRRVVAATRNREIQDLAQQIAHELFVPEGLTELAELIETVAPQLIIIEHEFANVRLPRFIRRTNEVSDAPIIIVATDCKSSIASSDLQQPGIHAYLRGRDEYPRLREIATQIESGKSEKEPDAGRNRFYAEDYAEAVNMAGRSTAMLNTLKMIKLVALSRCNPVLILGETGTGKELAARAVHNLRRPGRDFVAVNCAALTANLLESELFGHVKGAFTGADREKTGLLEVADEGTLFLDEISEMPLELQAKLLRVLQERTFRKVGGITDVPCNATIIASSNLNLHEETQKRQFRPDLYYRLSVSPITIPPLRSPKRRADIHLLAEYFVETSDICPEKNNTIETLTKLAVEALERYDWPGNVRELRNVIERAILLETTEKIGLSSIVIDQADCSELAEGRQTDHVRSFSLEKAERELIARALQETGWQKTRAAALLGITRATLYSKVRQYNIERRTPADNAAEKQTHVSPEPTNAPR